MPAALWLVIAEVVKGLVDYLGKVKQNNAQTASWTPEEKAAVKAKSAELRASHAWLTDEEGGG